MTGFSLSDLEATIRERAHSGDPESWTAKLYARGIDKAAQKLGEEAVETVIAAVSENDPELIGEASDLIFHLSILLAERGLSWDMIAAELDRRHGTSGHTEKAGRPQ